MPATAAEVAVYLELLRRESVVLDHPEPPARPLGEDPDDEYLIALARAAPVEALVSGDVHLLRLRDVIPVVTPQEFLDSLAQS